MSNVPWKWIAKILVEWTLGVLGGIVIGILGLLLGADIGGNQGFPSFGGAMAGWEAGGVFFGLLGISLGSFAGVLIVQRAIHKWSDFFAALLGAGLAFAFDFALYDFSAPPWTHILILVMPSSFVVIGSHWRQIRTFQPR